MVRGGGVGRDLRVYAAVAGGDWHSGARVWRECLEQWSRVWGGRFVHVAQWEANEMKGEPTAPNIFSSQIPNQFVDERPQKFLTGHVPCECYLPPYLPAPPFSIDDSAFTFVRRHLLLLVVA